MTSRVTTKKIKFESRNFQKFLVYANRKILLSLEPIPQISSKVVKNTLTAEDKEMRYWLNLLFIDTISFLALLSHEKSTDFISMRKKHSNAWHLYFRKPSKRFFIIISRCVRWELSLNESLSVSCKQNIISSTVSSSSLRKASRWLSIKIFSNLQFS